MPARNGPRFLAHMIDTLILLVAAFVLGFLVGLIEPQAAEAGRFGPLTALVSLICLLFPCVYYTVMNSSVRQATIGKSLMGLMIVGPRGERITKLKALARVVLMLFAPIAVAVPILVAVVSRPSTAALNEGLLGALFVFIFLIFWTPYIYVFFNARRQSLFDLACKTYVVSRVAP